MTGMWAWYRPDPGELVTIDGKLVVGGEQAMRDRCTTGCLPIRVPDSRVGIAEVAGRVAREVAGDGDR